MMLYDFNEIKYNVAETIVFTDIEELIYFAHKIVKEIGLNKLQIFYQNVFRHEYCDNQEW
jgi:predicted methyltransferase